MDSIGRSVDEDSFDFVSKEEALMEEALWKAAEDREIAAAQIIPDLGERFIALSRIIIRKLVNEGQIQALRAANEIPSDWLKFSALFEITQKLSEMEGIDRVVEVANRVIPETLWDFIYLSQKEAQDREIAAAKKIPDVGRRAVALSEIAEKLVNMKEAVRAQEVAREISDEGVRHQTFYMIVGRLVEIENNPQALKIAGGMPSPKSRSRAFAVIAEKLAEKQQSVEALESVMKALKAANEISNQWSKCSALAGIAGQLAGMREVEWAVTVAKEIPDNLWKFNAFLGIVRELTKIEDIGQAMDVAKAIPDTEWQKSDALYEIAKKLAEKGELDRALDVAKRILNVYKKSEVFSLIVQKLMERLDVDGAIGIVKWISYSMYKSRALSLIAKKLAETGDLKRAKEVVSMIPDEHTRGEIDHYIAAKKREG